MLAVSSLWEIGHGTDKTISFRNTADFPRPLAFCRLLFNTSGLSCFLWCRFSHNTLAVMMRFRMASKLMAVHAGNAISRPISFWHFAHTRKLHADYYDGIVRFLAFLLLGLSMERRIFDAFLRNFICVDIFRHCDIFWLNGRATLKSRLRARRLRLALSASSRQPQLTHIGRARVPRHQFSARCRRGAETSDYGAFERPAWARYGFIYAFHYIGRWQRMRGLCGHTDCLSPRYRAASITAAPLSFIRHAYFARLTTPV